MLGFPQAVVPSSLLCEEPLNPWAQALNDECKDVYKVATQGHHRPLSLLYHEIMNPPGQPNKGEQCLLLLRLSDIARRKGKLGPALDYSQKAENLATTLVPVAQRHNYAVALYSLGLLFHSLGSEVETLRQYNSAEGAFVAARQQWQQTTPPTQLATECLSYCDTAIPFIRELRKYVERSHRFESTSAVLCSVLVGAWPPRSGLCGSDEPLVDVYVQALSVKMRLRCGGDTYILEKLGGDGAPEPVIEPTKEYYLVKIPKDLAESVWFQGADYAMVCREPADGEFGITREIQGTDMLWGSFTRDVGGKFRFRAVYEADYLPQPKFVGESNLDRRVSGTVIGIFKKEP